MDDRKDSQAFSQALAALALSFDKEASDAFFEAYWLGLSDLTIEAVQKAVALAIRQCEFMPKPVELRRLAGEQTGEQRAIAAWGDVMRAVPLGSYKHIDFADKLVNATIRNLGGWPTFIGRLVDEESEKWVRLEFLKTYSAMSSSGVNGEACLPLPGLSQQTAIGGVLQAPVPVRIECDQARLLLSSSIKPESKSTLPVIEFHKV